MALIRLLVAPIRRIVNFPLFQLMAAIAAILLLQAADSRSVFGQIFSALDLLVDFTVRLCGSIFEVKSFTKSWLTSGFMIAYVYIAGLLIVFLVKAAISAAVEFIARSNTFGLANAIAHERGIAAYRAWLPLERIRPAHIAQEKWEETFAWPADGKPPYPPLAHRVVRAIVIYLAVVLTLAALLQLFTPFPALTWLSRAARMLVMGG
jgi:hypothetical protein